MLVLIVFAIGFYIVKGTPQEGDGEGAEELAALEVDFEVPETAEVGETVPLKATVYYGDSLVIDAEEVTFEIWEQGLEEESIMLDTTNHQDGTYTAETNFEKDGIYEMYAHTTARDLHTMPKKTITIGNGVTNEE
ncbi:hypothetical protein D8M04_08175 [Oceanobacillus piezotolerans]|uniref:YtkA-like domain-containing protein n=2 Tax=Oceanobacillus piezotolerans TaxID=2448030 RepID=A0A498D7R8_9BACI|nr:hypothetical protein D8M04_08175 [Oceanobacillus piezotolerans]